MQKTWLAGLFATAALAGCASGGATTTPALHAIAETAPTAQSDANAALIVPRANGGGLIIGSSETTGIELYGLDGARLGA
ncbi:MAG TPA: hypothetical protein VM915_13485, partial [Verrucomicrobiae bacterium]|nr:hypothetical protein [Verrucomicrobiae bacterium]